MSFYSWRRSATRRRRSHLNAATVVVRATCDSCGDVELTGDGVKVLACVDTGVATFAFVCPCCGYIVNKSATNQIVASLTSAGCALIPWRLPAELDEPKVGPKIDHDDLLSFHLALESEECHQELANLASKG